MKNFRLLLIGMALLGVSFSSCNKDDDDDPTFEERIEGIWYVTLIQYDNCPDPQDNESQVLPGNCDTDECFRFTFEDNGTMKVFYSEDGDTGEDPGTYAGDEENLTLCIDGDCVSGTMEFNGNRAVFSYEEDGCDVSITFNR